MKYTHDYWNPETAFLQNYRSLEGEVSIYKGVPIALLERTKKAVKPLLNDIGHKYIVRFRGPRPDRLQQSTKRKDATHFSVYAGMYQRLPKGIKVIVDPDGKWEVIDCTAEA